MKILDVMWFCSGHGNAGIVRVDTEIDGIRYYLGACKGVNEQDDKEWIAAWGSTFPKEAGDVLFGVNDGTR